MTQELVYLYGPKEQEAAVRRRLEEEGFRVGASKKIAGGILVRVRTDTDDEAQVLSAAAEIGPDLRRGPASAATVLPGYREGF